MPALCTCHVPNHTTLLCVGLNRLGLIEVSRQIADFVVSDRNK
jgi:hypothetical protein